MLSKHTWLFYMDTNLAIANLRPFRDGLAIALASDRDNYGYINKNGVFVIPEQFAYANPFSEGLAAVGIGKDELR
jgi:hypothetical protein